MLGEKPLEQESHADRIDGGDAQRIADRAVGGRAAALDEDVLGNAVADQVMDDEEISGQAEAGDELQLALDLRTGFGPSRARLAAVTAARALLRAVP